LNRKGETERHVPAQRIFKKRQRISSPRHHPRAAEFDKSGEFHSYLSTGRRASNIFAMAVPQEYGGLASAR